MLSELKLKNVGPAPGMEVEFGKRLTLVTGDNSLGKSFVLDTAWWALTGVWPAQLNRALTSGSMARPGVSNGASITYQVVGDSREPIVHESKFDIKAQQWKRKAGRPANPGMVVYAMADGAFAVWDPSRNYWNRPGELIRKQPAYVFAPKDVWNGLYLESEGKSLCEGLIRDVSAWFKDSENRESLDDLNAILKVLSPNDEELISIGEPIQSPDPEETRMIPTLNLQTGQQIPVTYASSAIKRILGMSYLIHWAWKEHQRSAIKYRDKQARQLTLIIDEPEVHLHPKWQSKILVSLLELFKNLNPEGTTQIIASSHSPLVLGSLEGEFSSSVDRWYDFDLVNDSQTSTQQVVISERQFVNQGRYAAWLTSNAFDLSSDRTTEGDRVYQEARQFMDTGNNDLALAHQINNKVITHFTEEDPFYVNWKVFYMVLNQQNNLRPKA